MGFFARVKETFTRDDAVKKGATAVGQAVGLGVGKVARAGKEMYMRRYGGGEYRKERIKEQKSRTEELKAKAKFVEAKGKLAKAQGASRPMGMGGGGGFNPNYQHIFGNERKTGDYGFITGGQKKAKKNPYDFLGLK